MSLHICQIVNGKWKENCYIVHNKNNSCIVIDPGSEAHRIIKYIENKELKVHAILNTHGHYDHICAVDELKTKFSAPFYLHSKDLKILQHANLYMKLFDGDGMISIPKVDFFIDKIKNPINLRDFKIKIIFTPGHTSGEVCFFIEDYLFTGDTLFKGRIGRVDLPGGNKDELFNSLKNLSGLPPRTKLYPGHGRITTLLEELENNKEFSEAL